MQTSSYAVLSFPRSGTDFLFDAITINPGIAYSREYFNPICNPARADMLETGFGDERLECRHAVMNDLTDDAIHNIVMGTWKKDPFNTTKENYSATKIRYFAAHFTTAILMRKHYHTFPTTRPDYTACILDSFLTAGRYRNVFLRDELNELRRFVINLRMESLQHTGLLGYIVAHYIFTIAADVFNIPILWYEDLVMAAEQDLAVYLGRLHAFPINPSATAAKILEDRPDDPEGFLRERRRRYDSELAPNWLQATVEFLCQLSPEFETEIRGVFDRPEERRLAKYGAQENFLRLANG